MSESTPAARLFDLGLAAHKNGDGAEALRLYSEVLVQDPWHFNALHLSGLLETEAGNLARAVHLYQVALTAKPDSGVAWYNLGVARQAQGNDREALLNYDRAITFKPDLVQAFINRGNILRSLRREAEALANYEAALAADPDFVPALVNRGVALRALKRPEAALASFTAALERSPRTPEALFNQAMTLIDLKNYPTAIDVLDRLAAVSPRYPELATSKLFTQLRLCDWRDYDTSKAAVLSAAQNSETVIAPFPILTLTEAPDIQRLVAEAWTREKHPPNAVLGAFSPRPAGSKIRLGYFSLHYRDHATAHLIAGLIETHDRDRFEVIAFSYGPETGDAMHKRLVAAFDTFVDISILSDVDAAARSRAMGIDIAIELAGHIDEARTGIFAARAAPLQVNYLCYPGTMGAPYFDYIIADPVVVPPGAERFYSENVVRLPHSYQPNDRHRTIGPRVFTREDLGLPPSGFVFCCFNNCFKITPATFRSWMNILAQVDGSVLWLLEDHPAAVANLRIEAAARGIAPARLVFARRASHADHLSRHRAADLLLDTLPYNAHTTASDALWCGMPVLTQAGASFAGRVAASLLAAVGLSELITTTDEEYVALAVKLARDPLALAALRQRLQEARLTAPLFDTERYTRDLEAAFTHMLKRHHDGLDPTPLDIPAG